MRRVCHPHAAQKSAERLRRELRSAVHAHRYHHHRAPTLAGAAVHPQASDDWIESEVGLSWRRAAGLYPKRHGWGRGVVMAELDIRFQRIWSQTRVPVILHQGTIHGAFACEKEAGAAGARGTRNGQ
jgi:hypothetical protein